MTGAALSWHRTSGSWRRSSGVWLAICALVFAGTRESRGESLTELVQSYRGAIAKVNGPINGRAAKVREHVAPVLERIAAVDSEDSLRFLITELDNTKTIPEVREAIPEAVVAHSRADTVDLLLRNVARRSPESVQAASFAALRRTKRDLSAAEDVILKSVAGVPLAPETVTELAAVLGKLDSARGLALLVEQLGSRGARADEAASKARAAVISSYEKSKSDAVKAWIANDGFSAAGSDSNRLVAVSTLAGLLEVAGAHDSLEKLVGHRSAEVSAAAIQALSQIGLGGAADAVARAVERSRRDDLDTKIQGLDALARSGDPKAVAAVIRAAQSRDVQTRAVAMGSLAFLGSSSEAMDALLAGLDDRDPSVRNVALRSLGRVRYKPMVGALIDAASKTRDPSFQVRILELLVTVSGQNMGLEFDNWRKWWDFNKDRFEFPSADAVAGVSKLIVRDLSYFGIEVSSKRLGFLVDASGSMRETVAVKKRSEEEEDSEDGEAGRTRVGKPRGGGDGGDGGAATGKALKIDVLKRELSRLLAKLSVDTQVNIVSFDATIKPWQKNLQPLAGSGRTKAIDYVKNLNTGSGTNVFDTLEFALQDNRVDTIYLLTDGLPTRGRLTDAQQILDEVRRLNRVRAVTIHTIAFGEKSDLLEKLAAENSGQYRFVDSY